MDHHRLSMLQGQRRRVWPIKPRSWLRGQLFERRGVIGCDCDGCCNRCRCRHVDIWHLGKCYAAWGRVGGDRFVQGTEIMSGELVVNNETVVTTELTGSVDGVPVITGTA